jgi:DNA repair protein RadC
MENEKNVHDGHRRRLTEKILKHPEAFSDHEVLEVLLFFSIPRKDTNPIAHRLLRTFGSLENVLKATDNELIAVDGIGRASAAMLRAVGELLLRINAQPKKKESLSNLEEVKQSVIDSLDKYPMEKSLFIMLDKKYNKIAELSFTDTEMFRVKLDMTEIVSSIVALKPSYAVLAHNHIGYDIKPSIEDDLTTKKLFALCDIHGVGLLDHVIINSKKEVFSYRKSGLMDKIKQEGFNIQF